MFFLSPRMPFSAFAAFVLISLIFTGSVCADPGSPTEKIRKFNAALLECMQKANDLGYQGRYRLLDPVIHETFALSYMADVSLGKFGKTLGEKERRQFIDIYSQWTVSTYAGRFDDYSGEKFETGPESKLSGGTVTVVVKLLQPKDDPVVFIYHFRHIDGSWRIADIHIEGVSQLALTRSQFSSIIKKDGFDSLVSRLKTKIRNFEQGEKER